MSKEETLNKLLDSLIVLLEFPPIENKEQNAEALAMVELFMDLDPSADSVQGEALRRLATQVETFEKKTYK